MLRRLTALSALLALAGPAAAAHAGTAERPWPPAGGPGTLFAHFGEEHINDADGATLLPKVVEEVARYRPRLVTTSGDKANDGKADQFTLWQAAMKGLDDAGVPYLAGAGNHDRTSPPGVPGGTAGLFGGTLPDSFDTYKAFFAARPYPWGDGTPYEGIGASRPADDPAGAAATYVADVGDDVRWIFLDNSCWGLTSCDAFQARADGSSGSQLGFLEAKAREATQAGRSVFVVMHMPTRDPRDQAYTDLTARQHTMGKGTTTDNSRFEEIAAATGVDGVFLGHIKGQFQYRAKDVPYFIDGGAGGELYTEGPVGTDHGYWHGFRLLRVDAGRVTTDTVPIFVPDSLRIEGPDTVRRGGPPEQFAGFGRQPVFNDPAKVEALELRDPDPKPKGSGEAQVLGVALADLAYGAPVLLLLLLLPLTAAEGRRRRLAVAGGVVVLGGVGAGTIAVAQQSIPTATGRSALPEPARIWTTSDARVLAPVASDDDDPRRDARTQTEDGRFTGVCPGRATLRLTSGFEQTDRQVVVPSEAGRIVRSISRARTVRRSRTTRLVDVRLAQPAVVSMTLRRAGKVVLRKRAACVTGGRRVLRLGARRARPGRYALEVRVSSDRRPTVARYAVRVR